MVGFGVMSVPEFCYFFFIRPIFDLVLRRLPCAVRRVTTRKFQKVANGNGLLLGNKVQKKNIDVLSTFSCNKVIFTSAALILCQKTISHVSPAIEAF